MTGRRTDESCSRLMEKISVFPAARFHTDDWKSYRKYIPPSKHAIRKADTWRIESQRTKKFMIMSSACISIVIIFKTVDIQKVPDQRI
ncbi:MAG: IS1 family transposase [Candidatus Electronema sp. VV]